MDYKEKLRLAKEALDSGSYDKETIEYIFPELKESEDERIRKGLIEGFQQYDEEECWRDIEYLKIKDILTWLEKQGEQKPKFRVGDTIKCKHDDRIFTIKSIDLDKGTYTYTQEGCGNDIDYADEMFELVEQKPAWSEEDEQHLKEVIFNMHWAIKNCVDKEYAEKEIEKHIDWLKSLKERMKRE